MRFASVSVILKFEMHFTFVIEVKNDPNRFSFGSHTTFDYFIVHYMHRRNLDSFHVGAKICFANLSMLKINIVFYYYIYMYVYV